MTGRNLLHEQSELRGAVERLIARGQEGPIRDRKLAAAFKAHYLLCEDTESMSGLKAWLESLSPRSRVIRPWIALTRLAVKARASEGDPGGDLGFLDASLPASPPEIDLFLRTEAARLLYRLTGAAAVAHARLVEDPPPAPAFGDAAAQSARLRLHLAAAAGDWEHHDRLVDALDERWIAEAGPRASWVRVVSGQHAVQRGDYNEALQRVRPLGDHPDPEIRLAALEVGLQALLASGGNLAEGSVRAELDRIAGDLAPLLDQPAEDEEGRERRRRCERLLELVRNPGPARGSDPERELRETAAVLENGGVGLPPETRLSSTLRWVRLVLELRGHEAAEACEDLVGGVLDEAHSLGLHFLEMLAWDQRAIIRARYFESRWDEAVADAGHAARLAAGLLEKNREGPLERSLRATLLPIFDRAIELLAEGAWYAARQEPAQLDRHERFGRALHDYAEQLADLALSEARSHIHSGDTKPPRFPVADQLVRTKRSEDLQRALRPDEAVLQYLLVGRFLLVFAYGQSFFTWEVQRPEIEDPHPVLPIRSYLEVNYLTSWRRIQMESWSRTREVKTRLPASTRVWASPADCLRELADLLIPAAIVASLERHRIRHLSIVPHDVLYRTPFSSLLWGSTHLGARFTLSLHPTGELAGRSLAGLQPGTKLPLRVSFFKGPEDTSLTHVEGERNALAEAFGRLAEIRSVDTVRQGLESFAREATKSDVIYLACHGTETRLALGPRGSSGISLREAAEVDLHGCKLAVLQACWTGWMSHKREHPVQGFPQALLDAGAAAVVAPMFPVHDSLCPVFASVFGRALGFLPACNALAFALTILRRYGTVLLSMSPDTEPFADRVGAFDAYEYRFTGDRDLRLPGGWLRRGLSRVGFVFWLLGEVGYGRWQGFRKARPRQAPADHAADA